MEVTVDAGVTLDAPRVDPVTSPTGDTIIRVTGHARAGATVRIEGGVHAVDALCDDTGRFSVDVEVFADASTMLSLYAIDPISLQVSARVGLSIEHDGMAPSAPVIDALPEITGDTSLTIHGRAEAYARVRIQTGMGHVDTLCGADGRFSATVDLMAETENEIVAHAIDLAGNISLTARVRVAHQSAAPTLSLDAFASITNQTHVVIRGHAAVNARISIEGGAETAYGTCDAHGRFAIEVRLSANLRNELHLLDLSTGARAWAIIVHDDQAPSAPSLAHLSLDAELGLGCPLRVWLRGHAAVEAFAKVRVQNLVTGGYVIVDADATGSFEVMLNACAGQVLAVVAIDAAANVSAVTNLTVL